MAKGNPLLGFSRGKVGDIVLKRVRGSQVTVPRVASSNPQSRNQTITRLSFATAQKLAKQLERVVSNSYQSVRYGQDSINRFVRDAVPVITGYARTASSGYDADHNFGYAPLVPYSSPLAVAVPVRVSAGDLDVGKFVTSPSSLDVQFKVDNPLDMGSLDILSQEYYKEFFGVDIDCQITFIAGVVQEMEQFAAQSVINGVRYYIGRLNWRPDIISDVGGVLFSLDGDNWLLNPDSVDPARSSITAMSINKTTGVISVTLDGVSFGGSGVSPVVAAIIISKYQDGRWRRSTSYLQMCNYNKTIADLSGIGYNYLDDLVDMSRKGKASPSEDEYLNKEPI